MAAARKLINEVSKMRYERLDNDAKAFRFETEEAENVRKKIRYLRLHLRDCKEKPKSEKEQILIYGNMALAYIKLYDYEEARKYLKIQLEMSEEFKDEDGQRMAHGNLGKNYACKRDWLSDAVVATALDNLI